MKMKMKAISNDEIRMVRLANMRQREREKAANESRDNKIHGLHVSIVRVEGEIAAALKNAARGRVMDNDKVSRLSSSLVQLRAELRRARGVSHG